MQNHTVPNYADLFDDLFSYKLAVQEIPSDTIITVCIALINELNSPEDKFKLQERIYKALAKTFDTSDFQLGIIPYVATSFAERGLILRPKMISRFR